MASARIVPALETRLLMATNSEQRKERRVFVKMPVLLSFTGEAQEHVGFVRDMSIHGMFFYSDLTPALGSQMEFVMHLPQHVSDSGLVSCKGTVVRVEGHVPGAATGVALLIDECNVIHPAEEMSSSNNN